MKKNLLALIIAAAISGTQIYCTDVEPVEIVTQDFPKQEEVIPATSEATGTTAEPVVEPALPELTPEEEQELEKMLQEFIKAQQAQQEANNAQ